MKKLLLYGLILFSFFFFYNKGESETIDLKSRIIGKWMDEGAILIEFIKDGTVIVVDKNISIVGEYKFIDDTRVKLDLNLAGITNFFLPSKIVYTVSFKKEIIPDEISADADEIISDKEVEVLILTSPNGEKNDFLSEELARKVKKNIHDVIYQKNYKFMMAFDGKPEIAREYAEAQSQGTLIFKNLYQNKYQDFYKKMMKISGGDTTMSRKYAEEQVLKNKKK